MRTPERAGASTTLIESDDDSARKVTRANRSFRVSHPASDQSARSSRGHVGSRYISAPSSEPCCYTCECYTVRMRAVKFTYLVNDRYYAVR